MSSPVPSANPRARTLAWGAIILAIIFIVLTVAVPLLFTSSPKLKEVNNEPTKQPSPISFSNLQPATPGSDIEDPIRKMDEELHDGGFPPLSDEEKCIFRTNAQKGDPRSCLATKE